LGPLQVPPRWLGALAWLLAMVATREARAAILVDAFTQESVQATSSLSIKKLTVGNAADRYLVAVVGLDGTSVSVTSISWRGAAFTFAGARGLPMINCRMEFWVLPAPAPGNNVLQVTVSGSTAFGVGASSFTGVDPATPVGPLTWTTGVTGQVTASAPAASGSLLMGGACLAGTWTATGPSPDAPSAVPEPGQTRLWDYTEPGIVGTGGSVPGRGGTTTLGWNVSSQVTFAWISGGLVLERLGALPPPDAALPPVDVAVDQGPTPDARRMTMSDAPPLLAPDAETPDGREQPPDAAFVVADAGVPEEPDAAPSTVEAVNLSVGCACDLRRPPRGGAAPVFLVLAILWRRLRRS
jgi:hypothetical protein